MSDRRAGTTVAPPGLLAGWLAPSRAVRHLLEQASGAASADSSGEIEPRHVLLALIQEPSLSVLLAQSGVDDQAVRRALGLPGAG